MVDVRNGRNVVRMDQYMLVVYQRFEASHTASNLRQLISALNFCTQNRSIFVQQRGKPNAPELGRSPGELNRIAESDGSQEPARRSGEC